MEKMDVKVVEVLPELLALCERVEEVAKNEHTHKISWAFFPQSAFGAEQSQPEQGAVGFTAYREYSVSVWRREDGSWSSSAYGREVPKYDSEGWETHPCDDEYEEDED